MLIKITGMLLIILSTSTIGVLAGVNMQKHLEELQYIRQFLLMLRGEIKYRKQPLAEAFSHMSGRLRSPYRKWLSKLSEELQERRGISFVGIWETCIEAGLRDTVLTAKDKKELAAFGGQLGYLDMEMQLGVIDLYREQIDLDVERIRQELSAKKRLYHCLGVMAGIFLAVVLV